jgi:outer membrane protein
MNRTFRLALSSVAFGALALGLLAQEPALKIVTVDMSKILDNHPKTKEQLAKLRDDEQKAQTEMQQMVKEGNQLVEQYKEALDQSKNTLLTADARSKAEADSQKMLTEIQRRQSDLQSFRAQTQQSLQQRLNNFRSLLLDQISKTVTAIAKKRGATLVVDTSGPSLLGIPSVVYSDPAYDITDEVMAEINRENPPAATPAPATTGAAAPATTSSAAPAATSTANSPTVTVPGLPEKGN